MKKWLVVFAALGLVACASTDPYTGESKASNTAKGAGVGAVAGAVIGAASASRSDRRQGAITGAIAGGAIGGGIGYYMDRQEAALREQLQGSGVQVRREGDIIYLVMPGNITFDVNGDAIRSDFFGVLNSVALVLAEYDKTIIKASGHTDSTGSDAINNPLSQRRADSVRNYLISQKVSANRIHAVGYGSRYPVATNATAEGRQANRRVELELVPMD